ncbi:MAG TPA: YHS domain-containing protein [Methanocella sp.]|nr:YHS domain-containing protein [Methanocella sp.]
MATDPVCNMTVYHDMAASYKDYKGKHVCFCSDTCREAFDKNPDMYMSRPYGLME